MELAPGMRWLKVFSQPWEGDVTMVLPSTFMQIKKSITNPSLPDLQLACLQVMLAPCLKLCQAAKEVASICTSACCHPASTPQASAHGLETLHMQHVPGSQC